MTTAVVSDINDKYCSLPVYLFYNGLAQDFLLYPPVTSSFSSTPVARELASTHTFISDLFTYQLLWAGSSCRTPVHGFLHHVLEGDVVNSVIPSLCDCICLPLDEHSHLHIGWCSTINILLSHKIKDIWEHTSLHQSQSVVSLRLPGQAHKRDREKTMCNLPSEHE